MSLFQIVADQFSKFEFESDAKVLFIFFFFRQQHCAIGALSQRFKETL